MSRVRQAEERFWEKVAKDGPGGCWLWTAALADTGYGIFTVTTKVHVGAHRYSYELANGPVPKGLTIDHLCRVRACVNPDHLEAVTDRENIRRAIVIGTAARPTCKRGHDWSVIPPYVFARSDGRTGRRCRVCHLERQSARYNRRHVARPGAAA